MLLTDELRPGLLARVGVADTGNSPVTNTNGLLISRKRIKPCKLASKISAEPRPIAAHRPERRGVPTTLGREVPAVPEHVRPVPELQVRAVLEAAQLPTRLNHPACMARQTANAMQVTNAPDLPINGSRGFGSLSGVLRDVPRHLGIRPAVPIVLDGPDVELLAPSDRLREP